MIEEYLNDNFISSVVGNNKEKKKMCERVLRAFHLLSLLLKCDLEFVFKGGTSLMIILDNFDRFSVDIDVMAPRKYHENIESILQNISSDFEIKEDYRNSKSGILKRHFKFFYQSLYDDNKMYVLLDAVFEDYEFNDSKIMEIKSSFIKMDLSPLKVRVLSVNEILGDKITAFAPCTIGKLYSSESYTEIIKQLYDISKLADSYDDINIVKKTYVDIASIQIKNRQLDISYSECLLDTINSCKLIISDGKVGGEKKDFEFLRRGFEGFNSYLITSITFDELRAMAVKVYVIAIKLLYGDVECDNVAINGTFAGKRYKSFIQYLDGTWENKFIEAASIEEYMEKVTID